jgi:hypothetical protein
LQLLSTSDNPMLSQAADVFGPLWIGEQLFLLAAMLILGRWVWGYLLRRFLSQLFMILTALTLGIFLVTAISFTYLLVKNVQNASLDNLKTAASVLNYAIDSKKAEVLANTQSIAENSNVSQKVAEGDHKDPQRFGDSLSSDTMIRRALTGQANSGVTSKQGVIAPLIYIKSAVPIRDDDGVIIGAAVASLVADNSFVDGIKRDTGLDSAVYAGNVRSATTFIAPDGVSRWVGIKEADEDIQNKVIEDNETYQGVATIQNRRYLTVYAPLRDVDNTVVGMLFIGEPQSRIFEAANRSVQLTFIVTAVLLLLSIIPAFFLSRYLSYQME